MADIIARALAAKALAEIGSIGGGIKFKGTVATEADLPTSGNQNGDMYVAEDTGKQYIWNVTEEYPDGHWVSISSQIDLKRRISFYNWQFYTDSYDVGCCNIGFE